MSYHVEAPTGEHPTDEIEWEINDEEWFYQIVKDLRRPASSSKSRLLRLRDRLRQRLSTPDEQGHGPAAS